MESTQVPGSLPTCTWEVLVVVRVALRSGHPGLWVIAVKQAQFNHTDGENAGNVKTDVLTCPAGCLTRDNSQTQSSLDYSWTVDPASERRKENSPHSEQLELGNDLFPDVAKVKKTRGWSRVLRLF